MRGIKCCLDCKIRCLNCHSTCEVYKKEKERYNKEAEELKKKKKENYIITSYEAIRNSEYKDKERKKKQK